MKEWTWKPTLPGGATVSASLEPNQSRSIEPGRYSDTFIKSNATITLRPGTYRFTSLSFEPLSKLVLLSAKDPTIIYVDGNFTFRGQYEQPTSEGRVVPLLVVALGDTVAIDTPFTGNIFAPNGRLSLPPGRHKGNFYAADLELQPDAIVETHSFFWSRLIPSGPFDFRRSPIEIDAWKDLATGEDHPSEASSSEPVTFKIPRRIMVRSGNGGNGEVKL